VTPTTHQQQQRTSDTFDPSSSSFFSALASDFSCNLLLEQQSQSLLAHLVEQLQWWLSNGGQVTVAEQARFARIE